MMRRLLLIFCVPLFLFSCSTVKRDSQQVLQLYYDKPATRWEETLPLGNGRIGMMIDGGIEQEEIVLNDITMWSGSVDPETINPDAREQLPVIRQLLLEGKNEQAQELVYRYFKCGGKGSHFGNGKDAPYGSFQLLGNLKVKHLYPDQSEVTEYRRTLSLNDAVATTQFQKGKVTYQRHYFASHTDDLLVAHYTADQRDALSMEIALDRSERVQISVHSDEIVMQGQLNDGYDSDQGVCYFFTLKIKKKGGTHTSTDSSLIISQASEVTILMCTSTNMLEKNHIQTVQDNLSHAEKYSFRQLKKRHIEAYREKFDRVELDLGPQNLDIPTNQRLLQFQSDDDPALVALYFQYGRYLMISGTRENSLPLNLQGLWTNQVQTPWNGDYHLNINVQMNYWLAEVGNLAELHLPLIRLTESLQSSGERTAQGFYQAEGWVAHMMTNPWHFTAPGEHASWGATNTGGAWLCAHLWEHYQYGLDTAYLRSVYPIIRGAAQFFLSAMIEEPRHNYLVTAPSSSPENGFKIPGSDQTIYVCLGPTMDAQIIRELFTNLLSAAQILGSSDEVTEAVEQALFRLPPNNISPKGYLMEWLEDYEEVDTQHRHVSHLYGLYPSNQISPDFTPEWAQAAKVTLNRRGDGGTGWSRAWKINFWARLKDGNRAYSLLKKLLEPAWNPENKEEQRAGTYPNLFCAHPPFQIDGNFGGSAGIAEMLIQSQHGFIELLPALPDRWEKGSLKGVCVRGAGEVDLVWENRQVQEVTLRAKADHQYRIKIPDYVKTVKWGRNKVERADTSFVEIDLKKGEEVTLQLIPF